ncbi:MAG: NUDIX domain-containing protein [Planctomycetota bacterium]|jgi:8-oxo-dGTP pyrophosphatase MutT (NUDIX family)
MLKPPFGSPEEKNWTVKEQREVSRNPWFRLLESRVQMPDQRFTRYFTLDFLRAAVGVVPRRPGEILLIRQYRFIIDEFVWAIPSGGVEKTEDFRIAAERELYEETGYRAKKITPIQSYYPSYGCGNQEFHLFLAEQLEGEPKPPDQNEVLEVRWFTDEAVKEMIFAGQIVDGLSLTPLLFLFTREIS